MFDDIKSRNRRRHIPKHGWRPKRAIPALPKATTFAAYVPGPGINGLLASGQPSTGGGLELAIIFFFVLVATYLFSFKPTIKVGFIIDTVIIHC